MSTSPTSSPSSDTHPSKASFTILEGPSKHSGSDKFYVQYNPKEFKVDKKVAWKEKEEQGKDASPLEFQKGSPRTITMELMFDTTYNSSGTSVYEEWVKKLLVMTNVDATPEDGEAAKGQKKRPTKVQFLWGDF